MPDKPVSQTESQLPGAQAQTRTVFKKPSLNTAAFTFDGSTSTPPIEFESPYQSRAPTVYRGSAGDGDAEGGSKEASMPDLVDISAPPSQLVGAGIGAGIGAVSAMAVHGSAMPSQNPFGLPLPRHGGTGVHVHGHGGKATEQDWQLHHNDRAEGRAVKGSVNAGTTVFGQRVLEEEESSGSVDMDIESDEGDGNGTGGQVGEVGSKGGEKLMVKDDKNVSQGQASVA